MFRTITQVNPIFDIRDRAEFVLAVFYTLVCLGTIALGIWFMVSFADILGIWRYFLGSYFIFWGVVFLVCGAPRL